jgi:hypothetical protein
LTELIPIYAVEQRALKVSSPSIFGKTLLLSVFVSCKY